MVRGLVEEMSGELSAHRRVLLVVAAVVVAFIVAGGVASALRFEAAVIVIAAIGMLGAAVAVLVHTARSRS